MSVDFPPCPNCRDGLIPFRKEKQVTGRREVILDWVICPSCSHVSLQRWIFLPGLETEAPGRESGQ